MTSGPPETEPPLTTEAEERIAQRVVELLAAVLAPAQASESGPDGGRLLSAGEVSAWWHVDRGWVYRHADELGAIRLGTGTRPRLRFDPDRIAQRLGARPPTACSTAPATPCRADMRGSAAIDPDAPDRLHFRRHSELSSTRPYTRRPGGAPTPPAVAPKTKPPAR